MGGRSDAGQSATSGHRPRHPTRWMSAWDGLAPEGRIVWALRMGGGSRRDDAGLYRPPDVSMMQATNFGNRHDRAQRRRLDGPPGGRIRVEREVSSCAVIIREEAGQDAAQVGLVKDEDMVQTRA